MSLRLRFAAAASQHDGSPLEPQGCGAGLFLWNYPSGAHLGIVSAVAPGVTPSVEKEL